MTDTTMPAGATTSFPVQMREGIRESIRRVRGMLPQGSLPEEQWKHRHRWIVVLVFGHAVGITAFGLVRGYAVLHTFEEGAVITFLGISACLPLPSRKIRSALGALGLVTSSALLVHFSGGSIEAHFHFFVALSILTLYQDWSTFLLALGYVVVHHGVFGVIDPNSVYNHPAAWANPWKWAAIHGAFVLAASAGLIISWRVNEVERARAEQYRRQLSEARIRRQQALEINDNIVQGLTVAQMALSMDLPEESQAALISTLEKARELVSDLLGEAESETGLTAGELVRANPATLRPAS